MRTIHLHAHVHGTLFAILLLPFLTTALVAQSKLPLDSCEAATVRVIAEQEDAWSVGSGLVIGAGRYVLTAEHVVDAPVVEIVTASGDEIRAVVAWKSKDLDLALLRLHREVPAPDLAYVVKNDIHKTAEVFVLGFPALADRSSQSASQVKVTKGIISAIVEDENGRGLYQIDAPINPGNSGGPVFDEYGHVIGIAIEKPMSPVFRPSDTRGRNPRVEVERMPITEGVGWAVRIEHSLDAIEHLGISFPRAIKVKAEPRSAFGRMWDDYPLLVLTLGVLFVLVILTLALSLSGRGRTMMRNTIIRHRPSSEEKETRIPYLVGVSDALREQRFPLADGPIVIGRDPAVANIILDSSAVSKRHCGVSFDAKVTTFLLEDFGSTNGTFTADGERVKTGERLLLKAGDRFYLADTGHQFAVTLERKQ
jgi:hypothetical protein